jgi:hypothetical protein
MGRHVSSLEGFMIVNGKEGDTFYSKRDARFIMTVAAYYKRNVKTAKVLTIHDNGTVVKTEHATQVTLLSFR